jgi:molybdopterin converting factor small subunit
LVSIRIELFGQARLLAGRRDVEIEAPRHGKPGELTAALATACPELVGKVILDDRSGLQPSYTLNLNGTKFIDGDTPDLKPGDALLLFSSQAGG